MGNLSVSSRRCKRMKIDRIGLTQQVSQVLKVSIATLLDAREIRLPKKNQSIYKK